MHVGTDPGTRGQRSTHGTTLDGPNAPVPDIARVRDAGTHSHGHARTEHTTSQASNTVTDMEAAYVHCARLACVDDLSP